MWSLVRRGCENWCFGQRSRHVPKHFGVKYSRSYCSFLWGWNIEYAHAYDVEKLGGKRWDQGASFGRSLNARLKSSVVSSRWWVKGKTSREKRWDQICILERSPWQKGGKVGKESDLGWSWDQVKSFCPVFGHEENLVSRWTQEIRRV